MNRRLMLMACAALLLIGCTKKPAASSGTAGPSAWLAFEVYEAGTGDPLSAIVWPQDMPDDFETVFEGEAGTAVKFEGLGRRDEGYALPIKSGQWINLMVWSPGHELQRVNLKVAKGENLVGVRLKRTKVEDERVPETILIESLEALPSQGPKSGG